MNRGLLIFFVVAAHSKPVPDGPYQIKAVLSSLDYLSNPCFLLKVKVKNGKRILGLGTCCDQDTSFRILKPRQVGGTTTVKIMSNDLKYTLNDDLEFVNANIASSLTENETEFKMGNPSWKAGRTSLQRLTSETPEYIAVNGSTSVTLITNPKKDGASFLFELTSKSSSSCNTIAKQYKGQNKNYCELIKDKSCG